MEKIKDFFRDIVDISLIPAILIAYVGAILSLCFEEVRWVFVRAFIMGLIVLVISGIIKAVRGASVYAIDCGSTAFIASLIIIAIIFCCNYEKVVDHSEKTVSNLAIYDEIIECDDLYIPYEGTKIVFVSDEIARIEYDDSVKYLFGEEFSRKRNFVVYLPTPTEETQTQT